MLETVKKFLLRNFALHFEQLFVDHVGPWLDAVDIARLAMTCKWNCERIQCPWALVWARGVAYTASQPNQDNLTERLYKQVCDRLDFKQTGTRSRPVPWVQIFVQHLSSNAASPPFRLALSTST